MKIYAIIANPAITSEAVVNIVFAILKAVCLSFIKYDENIGKKAAVSAPAIKRLNNKSGIKKEALYVSVALVVPKFVAIILSL